MEYKRRFLLYSAPAVCACCFALAFAGICAQGRAQTAPLAPARANRNAPSAEAILSAADRNGNDLAALLALQTRQAELTDTLDKAWDYWQMLAVCLSRVGDYNGALEATGKVQQRALPDLPKPTDASAIPQAESRQDETRSSTTKPATTKPATTKPTITKPTITKPSAASRDSRKPDAAKQAETGDTRQGDAGARRRLAGYTACDALDAIAAAARTRRVVMINEAHHVPQHRVFTTRLLAALYRQGYRWFAAETLRDADTDLNRRGYPTRRTGFYTAEPTYGELVRAALRLGYHVVPYEAEGKGEMRPGMTPSDLLRVVEERERGQAANLIQRVFKADPHARLLVHVGYGHASKSERSQRGFHLMGWHFKHLSGLNALTIDQTTMTEADAPERENALYRRVADGLTDAAVFRRGPNAGRASEAATMEDFTSSDYNAAENCFVEGGTAVGDDMQVFHPRYHSAQGRPDWLENGTGRVVVRVPDGARQAADRAGRALIRAYVPREAAAQTWRAIPFDQILVEKDRPVRALMLAPGRYRLQAWTAAGKIVYDAPLVARGVPHDVNRENLALRAELRRMAEKDQEARLRIIPAHSTDKMLIEQGRRVDDANRTRMKQIVARYGWPGKSLVGREGAGNAFLLVQHSDPDPAFQRRCLPLLRKAAEQDEAAPSDAAYLTDRVLLAQGKKQRYGTQFMRTPSGEMAMRPTEDETHLDARRRAMNMPPVAEYAQMIRQMYVQQPASQPDAKEAPAPDAGAKKAAIPIQPDSPPR